MFIDVLLSDCFVKSNTDSKVLLLTKNQFYNGLEVFAMDRESLCHSLLQKVRIVKGWGLTKIVDLSPHFKKEVFEPGAIIYDVGSPSDNIYFI